MDEREQIKERVDIVELISESVRLKKAGRHFKALCPFHSERTPSFVVSPERQIWRCFGCGKGGDVFSFLMELDRIEFPQALRLLAGRAGVKLTGRQVSSQSTELKQTLLDIHHLAAEFFHYLLLKHKLGEAGRDYLTDREISGVLINTFYLGFAPNAWDNLYKFLRKKKYQDSDLEKSGLVLRGRTGFYDRFRGRVMFPIKNYRGETIAFSGRLLDANAKEAKYINSPETPLYTKGNTLYGLDVTREAIRQSQQAVIVEGEFDVISSYQAGVANVVAIKGTALTSAQVKLLKRFAAQIIFALDADVAGDAAARRGIEIADNEGLEIKVIQTLGGKDPDEVARLEPHVWKKAVSEAVPYYDFLISSALARYNPNDAYGKKRITDEILPQIALISNPIVQAHYLKILSQKISISEEKLADVMRKSGRKVKQAEVDVFAPPSEQAGERLEKYVLALVFQSQDVATSSTFVFKYLDPSDFTHPVVKKISMDLIDYLSIQKSFDLNKFSQGLAPEFVPTLDGAYLYDLSAIGTGKNFDKELKRAVFTLKRRIIREKLNQISRELTKIEDKNAEKNLALQQEWLLLSQELKALASN